MKTLIIQNGKLSLILVPETELEKQSLSEIFKTGDIEAHSHEKIQVLDKALVDSVVITSSSTPKLASS